MKAKSLIMFVSILVACLTMGTTWNSEASTRSGADSAGAALRLTLTAAFLNGSGNNLVKNSSLESGSGSTPPSGFDVYNNTPAGPPEPTTTDFVTGRTGGQAWRIAWSVDNTTTKGFNFTGDNAGMFGVDQWYVLSFYTKATGTAVGKALKTGWNHHPYGGLVELLNPALTTDWQRYAWKFHWGVGDTPDNNGFITVVGACQGSLTFDDVQVELGETLTPYNLAAERYATITQTLTTYATQTYADAKKSEAISTAAGDATSKVSTEASARATSDGYLSAMYVIKVDAGGHAAGFRITAIADPATRLRHRRAVDRETGRWNQSERLRAGGNL